MQNLLYLSYCRDEKNVMERGMLKIIFINQSNRLQYIFFLKYTNFFKLDLKNSLFLKYM